jgi:hypothetical protein
VEHRGRLSTERWMAKYRGMGTIAKYRGMVTRYNGLIG